MGPKSEKVHLRNKIVPTEFLPPPERQTQINQIQTMGTNQCLFISDKVICLVYIYDTLLYANNINADMGIEVEDNVAEFLGVRIDQNDDGEILMTQMGLIERMLKALNIGDKPCKKTPAIYGCLGKDGFNYASVIGQLQYLQGHAPIDITMAVSQCGHFTHNPKRSDKLALEKIGQHWPICWNGS
jgi:hypothetical protein